MKIGILIQDLNIKFLNFRRITLSVEVKTDNSIDSNEETQNKDFEDIIIKQFK